MTAFIAMKSSLPYGAIEGDGADVVYIGVKLMHQLCPLAGAEEVALNCVAPHAAFPDALRHLNIVHLRVELEGFIVRLAVPCITEAQFQRLEGIITQMSQRQKDGDLMGYSALNQQFHAIIYDACRNKTATDILIKLKQQMRKYNMKTILVPGRNTHSLQEHKAILEAIRLRDAAGAEAAVRTHVDSVRRTFQENLSLLF